MKNTLVNALTFTAGVAIGSLVTWKLVKNKYEQIAQEEIDSVKEVFARRQAEYDKAEELIDEMTGDIPSESIENDSVRRITDKPSLQEYAKILGEEKYTDYTQVQKEEEGGGTPVSESKQESNHYIYVIAPEAFGMVEENDCESLRYYADGVLTDDWNEVIEDVANLVGVDFAKHFGEYDDDSVYVRNDLMGKDFEILKFYQNYSEVKDRPPHEMNIDDEDE